MRYAGYVTASALFASIVMVNDVRAQTADTDETGAYAQRMRELMRTQGYSQIDFIDLEGDRILANACSGTAAYRVTLNRAGRVLKRDETGACDPAATGDAVSPEVVIDALYGRGYLRLNIVDRTPPTLLVHACRGERKFQIRMDAEGEIIDTKEDGACNLAEGDPLQPKEIERILTLQGYGNIRMPAEAADSYTVTACHGIREFQLEVTESAQVTMRKTVGFCQAGTKNVEYLPPRPVEEDLIAGTDALEPEGCQIVADWLQYQRPITFAKESAELSEEDLDQVEKLAAALKRCEATRVLIEGHTSKSGSDELNQELSEKRALAVRQALTDQGIAADRLTARGFGEAYPRFVTGAEDAQNRRIELNLEWDDA